MYIGESWWIKLTCELVSHYLVVIARSSCDWRELRWSASNVLFEEDSQRMPRALKHCLFEEKWGLMWFPVESADWRSPPSRPEEAQCLRKRSGLKRKPALKQTALFSDLNLMAKHGRKVIPHLGVTLDGMGCHLAFVNLVFGHFSATNLGKHALNHSTLCYHRW